MKRLWKKIFSWMLALALVVTMIQWPLMAEAASTGVVTITNAGFEDGVSSGWTVDDSATSLRSEVAEETSYKWAGLASAKIYAKNRTTWGEVSYITLTSTEYQLTAGMSYTFGGYVALQTGNEASAGQQIYAQFVDANGNAISGAKTSVLAPENGAQGWTKIMASYTPTANQSVKLQFRYEGVNGGKLDNSWAAYVDNVFCSLENADFELTNSAGLLEAWESEDVTIGASTTAQNGAQSIQLTKDDLKETATVQGTALYPIDKTNVGKDFALEWGMYQSSRSSDSFVRLDVTLYDENYQVVEQLTGTRSMLSRADDYSGFVKNSTVMTVPYEAAYINYNIVFSSGKADVMVDSIFWNVFSEEERTADSEAVGWSAEEIWYPENEKEDGVWQFRYFRTKVTLPKAIEGTELRLQVVADDSFSTVIDGNFVWNALYVNGKAYYTVAAKTVKNNKTVLTYIVPTSDLSGATELVIATRVLNCNSYAGLIIQGFAILNSGGSGFNYETVIETKAENTVASKLGCTEPMDGDNYNEFATWTEPATDANWYAVDYDDSAWVQAESRGAAPYGNMGDIPFDWKYSDGFFIYDSGEDGDGRDVSVVAGETAEVVVPGAYAELYGADVYTAGKPATPTKVKAILYKAEDYANKANAAVLDVVATVDVDIVWNPAQTGSTFSFSVPDYLESGTYKVILQQVRFANGANTDNVLANVTVTSAEKEAATGKAETEKGAVRLKVNGETVSPVMYLRPSETVYYNYATMSEFENSGVEIYSTYNGFLDGADGAAIWTDEDTIDYNAFDLEIYKTLDLNKDAMLIVNINLDAPDWWMEANPNECIKLEDGTTLKEVSFASTEYRKKAAAVVTKLVRHMTSASYRHRVVGVKLTAGRTYEWMNFTQSDDGYIYTIDYSAPMIKAFGGSIPTVSGRSDLSDGILLDPASKSAIIKYNKLLSQCVTDSILEYAKAAKAVNENWLVGVYNGYIWNESSATGIGSSHTTVEQILESTSIDFISSPVNYGERINGYSTEYMAASESIAAHGKLYILEQDNRTAYGYVYSNPDAEGATYTAEETIQQLTRDTAFDLVSGNGLWYFDMQGGWYDHEAIEDQIALLKQEYDESLSLDMSTNSQVAVFIGSESYDYLVDDSLDNNEGTNDTYKLMSQLYQAQRLELSKMGTSYDTYLMEDLTSKNVTTDWTKYKLSIILSAFELSEEERTAISEKLQKNGNYVLWIYLPGITTDDTTAFGVEKIEELTGMDLTLSTGETALSAKVTSTSFGNAYDLYGAEYTYKAPFAVIDADGVTSLAEYTNGSGIAAAMKNYDTYTSVYSAVPNVPADSLRALCKAAGVHLYTTDKDAVIESNASYVAVHSQTSGDKTITLPANENGYKVYDVISKAEVTVEENTFVANLATAGDTGLYRVVEKAPIEILNKDWNGVLIENANFAEWAEGVPVGYAFNNNSKAAISKSVVEEKGYVAKLANPNGVSELYFEYAVEVENGKSYELSFDANFTGTGQAVYGVYNEKWETYAIADYAALATDKWERISTTFTATADETIQIRMAMWGGTTESVLKLTNLRLQVVGDNELIPNGTFTEENVDSNTGYFGWGMGSDSYSGWRANLVENGDMSQLDDADHPEYARLSGWEPRLNFISMESAQGADGTANGAVKMTSGDGTVVGGVTKQTSQFIWDWQTISLTENTDYELTFTGKAEKSSAVMFVLIVPSTVTGLDESQSIAKAEIAAGANAGTWQTASVSFNSGELTSVNVMIVCYDNTSSAGGDVYYVDEVSVTTANLVVNGNMNSMTDAGSPGYERLGTPWADRLDFITMEFAENADGIANQAVKMTSGDGNAVGGVTKLASQFIWDWQTITLEANTDYTLSFSGKAEKSTAMMFALIVPSTVTGLDESQKIAKAEIAAGANAGTWQTARVSFNSGELTSVNVMIVCYDGASAAGGDVYYVDEVSVRKNMTIQNTPVISKLSTTEIEGVQFGGGNLCYLGAGTSYRTFANSTYILKLNTALSESGDVTLSLYNKDNSWSLDYNIPLSLTTTPLTQRFLISSVTPAYYEVRTTLANTTEANLLSLGNVSMKLNRGDFDEDNNGYPDAEDFEQMRKVLAENEEATENAKQFAEMNADGEVNSMDLVRMKLYEAGKK